MLTWALLLHLGFAVWMYGNPSLMAAGPVQVGSPSLRSKYQAWVQGRSNVDKIGLGPKLLRSNVFPVAVLFFVVLFTKLVRKFVAGPILAVISYVGG